MVVRAMHAHQAMDVTKGAVKSVVQTLIKHQKPPPRDIVGGRLLVEWVTMDVWNHMESPPPHVASLLALQIVGESMRVT